MQDGRCIQNTRALFEILHCLLDVISLLLNHDLMLEKSRSCGDMCKSGNYFRFMRHRAEVWRIMIFVELYGLSWQT
jgi:hypothetical protein